MEFGPKITTIIAAESCSQNDEKGNENFTRKQWALILACGLVLGVILVYVLSVVKL